MNFPTNFWDPHAPWDWPLWQEFIANHNNLSLLAFHTHHEYQDADKQATWLSFMVRHASVIDADFLSFITTRHSDYPISGISLVAKSLTPEALVLLRKEAIHRSPPSNTHIKYSLSKALKAKGYLTGAEPDIASTLSSFLNPIDPTDTCSIERLSWFLSLPNLPTYLFKTLADIFAAQKPNQLLEAQNHPDCTLEHILLGLASSPHPSALSALTRHKRWTTEWPVRAAICEQRKSSTSFDICLFNLVQAVAPQDISRFFDLLGGPGQAPTLVLLYCNAPQLKALPKSYLVHGLQDPSRETRIQLTAKFKDLESESAFTLSKYAGSYAIDHIDWSFEPLWTDLVTYLSAAKEADIQEWLDIYTTKRAGFLSNRALEMVLSHTSTISSQTVGRAIQSADHLLLHNLKFNFRSLTKEAWTTLALYTLSITDARCYDKDFLSLWDFVLEHQGFDGANPAIQAAITVLDQASEMLPAMKQIYALRWLSILNLPPDLVTTLATSYQAWSASLKHKAQPSPPISGR